MEEGTNNGDGATRGRRSAFLKRKRVVGKMKVDEAGHLNHPQEGTNKSSAAAEAEQAAQAAEAVLAASQMQFQTYACIDEPVSRQQDHVQAHAVVDGYNAYMRGTETGGEMPASIYSNTMVEQVEPEADIVIGKVVSIVYGRHSGLRANVVHAGDSKAVVQLRPSGTLVEVLLDELAEVGSISDERALTEMRMRTSTCSKLVQRNLGIEPEEDEPWLRLHIRVRVVDKSADWGRLYFHTGKIVEVLSPLTCVVLIDGTNGSNVRLMRRQLEPVVPDDGGQLVVLRGVHEGQIGKVIHRQDNGSAVIQMEPGMGLLAVRLEDVSEYLGV